ncbi:hypothetical protein B296_00057873, partial [Ensete ventricosum]
ACTADLTQVRSAPPTYKRTPHCKDSKHGGKSSGAGLCWVGAARRRREMGVIPEVTLSSGHAMPLVGLGTASYPPATPEAFRTATMEAIALGYRHFDTASLYGTEQRLGEVVADAIGQGLVKREELFITSKLWCTDAYADRVVPALGQSLR